MYNAHKLTQHSSEYTVYLWICKVYSRIVLLGMEREINYLKKR